jgi:uncharacterized protein YndB with AHSA1/START domain
MPKQMAEVTMPNETRSVEMVLDIAADPDVVWRALTQAEELVRWFPYQASVTPGPGGSVTWSWDDKWTWESQIDVWEPGRRLRLVQDAQRPFDVAGGVLPPGEVAPAHMVMDFTLESVKGVTRLRLVHSGFGHGEAWDDELDGVRTGWGHELRSLAFYLERHRGKTRHVGTSHLTWQGSQEDTWQRLLSPDAFILSPADAAMGAAVQVQVSTGDHFDGIVRQRVPNREFTATISALDDGIMRIGTHRAMGKTGIQVFYASYDARHAGAVRELAGRAQSLLERLFSTVS